MRNVGPNTQQALDLGILSRDVRLVIVDELGGEFPLRADLVPTTPKVQTDLDAYTWRMTATILATDETAGLVLRGRTIKAFESFVASEELSLFTGKIVEPKESTVYDDGIKKAAWLVECVGKLGARFDGHLTRFEWAPVGLNPDATDPFNPNTNEDFRLTGIVRQYKMTLPFSFGSGWVQTTNGAITGTSGDIVPVPSSAAFNVGDPVLLFNGYKAQLRTVKARPSGTQVQVDKGFSNTFDYPSGSTLTKAFAGVPVAHPFFGDTTLNSWWQVINYSTQIPITVGQRFVRDVETGAIFITLSANPGTLITVLALAVERWVIMKHRPAPYFYILAGVAGEAGSEKLNDLGTTTIRADKPRTSSSFYVTDPAGLFGANPYGGNLRYVSVWSGGREYRAPGDNVNKTIGHADFGKVTLFGSNVLTNSSGGTLTPAGGEFAANTSSAHYEILDPCVLNLTYTAAGTFEGKIMKCEPFGGFYLYAYKQETMPVWYADDFYDQYKLTYRPAPIALASGSFNPAHDRPGNDVAEFFKQLLMAAGETAGNLQLDPTGYTMAPYAAAQAKAGDVLKEAQKATIPPSYRIREMEDGTIRGSYVAQKTTPDLVIGRVKGFAPREVPKPFTRVIVKGKQVEINSAGRLLHEPTNIRHPQRMFDGFKKDLTQAADLTSYSGEALFRIPKCEPGRYPLISRVVVSHLGHAVVTIGCVKTPGGTARYLPMGIQPNQIDETFVKEDFAGFELASAGLSEPEGEHYLRVRFDTLLFGLQGAIDEIEVYLQEGPYWEASLTSDTTKAPADGASSLTFGKTWKVPNRDLNVSNRYAPPEWLERNRAAAGVEYVLTIELDGLTTSQAREIAEAWLDQVIRGAEFYECKATYDPRVQVGDTVEVTYEADVRQGDGSYLRQLVTGRFLVWGITKEAKEMTLILANYSR